ncbi:MAG TPA: amino acid adenylation domain-containing protein, partial [Polyangiaceae bacterium]|nr:amino acid adenylation domain-containing protein [Polyangiaceae bacterium]
VVGELDDEALRARLKAELPEYMVPSSFMRLDALPRTPSGKIDRKALPAPEVSASLEYVAPRSAAEEQIASIFSEVLGVAKVGAHDSFFELGGHSLLATQVASRLRSALGVELSLRSLFEAPTVAGLAERALQGGAETARVIPRWDRQGELPLSFGQERLWFLSELEPESAAYNMPGAVRLSGALDVGALERSLTEILRRHEVLRTSFEAVAGRARVVVHDPMAFELPVVDASEQRVAELAIEEARRPFDLGRAPLVRAKLLRLADDEHVLLFTMHHIASDGWSMGVLVREVAALYHAFVSGEASPLDELAIQYVDYASWQRSWLSGEVLQEQLGYWRGALGGAPPLELPTDRPRPPQKSYQGSQLAVALGSELTQELRELARQESATLFMTLLAGWQLLLSRYAGQRDVVVGSPIAGRRSLETEGLIGFFVNTLALRTDLHGAPSFRELLARVRATCLEAYTHQEVPFEQVMDAVQPERDLSRPPLFQVMFALQNAPHEELRVAGLDIEPIELDSGTSKFDLTLSLSESAGELRGSLEYDTDLFERESIQQLWRSFEVLLEAALAHPDERVDVLPIMTAAERAAIVASGSDTADDYDRRATLHGLFEAQAAATPERIAVSAGAERLSYAALERAASALAAELQRHGIGPGALVGFSVHRSARTLIGLLGILKAGGAYVPLDPSWPKERLAYMLADSGASVLLTEQALVDVLPHQGRTVLCIDALTTAAAPQPVRVQAEDLAYILYTSGSTGKPKGIAITHRSAAALSSWGTKTFSAAELSGVLAGTSISWDLSIFELFVPLSCGGRVIVVDSALELPRVPEPVTLVNTVPSVMQALLRLGELPRSVTTVNLAGEPLPRALVEQLYERPHIERVYNLYGPSEDTTYSTWGLVERAEKTVTIGRPVSNTQAHVIDDRFALVPIGVAGELYLGGDGLARGYHEKPEQTAERFVPDPFSANEGTRLYRTGDMVRWCRAGVLEYLGRVDFQVKLRGFRIELGEIESVLLREPGVQAACVLVREDANADKRLVAYVVGELDDEALRARLKAELPEYMVPSSFMRLDALPRTPSGKIDRKALPAPEVSASVEYVAPRSAVEEQVASIFSEVLGVAKVGAHDSFFELGGHSLLATQVTSRLSHALGIELALRTLFEAPTVAGFGERVEAALQQGSRNQTIERRARTNDLPLSFGQERLWFIQKLFPNDASYNLAVALRFRRSIDTQTLKRAFDVVVERHEILRSSYHTTNGQPVVRHLARVDVDIALDDLSSSSDSEARWKERIAVEVKRPFDLEKAPLLRVKLIRLADDDWVLALVMHHIISDGWSMNVLSREVLEAYEALRAGRSPSLPELTIQYVDYAWWQRRRLDPAEQERQLSYWQEHLRGAPQALDLPADFARPDMPSFAGETVWHRTAIGTGRRIHEVARRLGATPFMVMTAAFSVLMARLTGSDDIVVGTPAALRPTAETERLIGFFMNSLPLRVDLRGAQSFREVIDRVKRVCLEAYARQDVPFEQVLERVRPARDLTRTPLFQVFLNMLSFDEVIPAADFDAEPVDVGAMSSKFDLTLYMRSIPSGEMEIMAAYNRRLFLAERVRSLLEQLEALLEQGLAKLDQPLSATSLLTARARAVLPDPTTILDDRWMGSVHEVFGEQARRQPDALAVCDRDGAHRYGELDAASDTLAAELRAGGVGRGDSVAIVAHRSSELVVALLAVLKAGAAFVIVDPAYPTNRNAACLRSARPAAAIVLAQAAPAAETLADALRGALQLRLERGSIAKLAQAGPCPDVRVQVGPNERAYIAFTSGTTGAPKGIVGRHGSLTHFVRWQRRQFDLKEADRFSLLSGLIHDPLHRDIFVPLQTGGAICVPDPELFGDARSLVTWMAEARISVANLTPSMGRLLCEALVLEQRPRLSELRYALFVGEALHRRDAEKFRELAPNAQCVNFYGATETHFALSYYEAPNAPPEGGLPKPTLPLGRGVPDVQLLLMRTPGALAGIGEVGEIYVRSPHLTLGYLRDDELTAKKFVANPFRSDGADLCYRTGDLGRYGLDGAVESLGRRDDQVQIRGFRVELGEIESVLAKHPSVRDAVVVPLRDDARAEVELCGY